jgi:hypothetical protein
VEELATIHQAGSQGYDGREIPEGVTMAEQTRLPMNMREVRGQQIAAEGRIRKQPDAWIVPSQTQSGYYVVKRDKCTCPDYELHGVQAVHTNFSLK